MCTRHVDAPDTRCLRCREEIFDQHEQAEYLGDWQPWRWRRTLWLDYLAWAIVISVTVASLCVLWDGPPERPTVPARRDR